MELIGFGKSRTGLCRLSPRNLLAMKMIALLMTVTCLQLHANSFAQQVTLKRHNASLEKIFEQIYRQTGYQFVYSYDQLKQARKIDIDVQKAPLRDVLDHCFQNQPFTYVLSDKAIIVTARKAAPPGVPAQPAITLSGKVTDSTGNPLAGVTIAVKGGTTGTVTGPGGSFSLDVPDDAVLVVSYVGYVTLEVPVARRRTLHIVLKEEVSSLNQLVVVGYGTQKKKDLTGTVSRLDNTRFETLPNTNITQALRGTIPGVSISAGGNAGSGSSVSIRGQNSIYGGNDALIVVDGIIYNGQLGDLNPDDIASIDVLRDASSAAIFGSRAANGVILVTTKKGTTAKPTVQLNVYGGVQGMLMSQHLETPKQYVQKKLNFQKTLAFRGSAPEPDVNNPVEYLNAGEVDNYKNGIVTDPLKVITRTASIQSYNLSVGANLGKTNYYIAGNWTDQQGIVIGDQFKRASVRLNLESEITDWLKLGTRTSFSFVDVSGSPASLSNGINMSPYGTWYLDSAKTVLDPVPMSPDGLIGNPLMPTLNQVTQQRKDLFGILYAELSVPFVPGLTYRFTYSNDMISGINQTFIPAFNAGGLNRVASSTNSTTESQDMNLENLVKYAHKFSGDHNLDVTLLYNYNFAWNRGLEADANTFPSDVLSYYSLSLGENQSTAASYTDYHAISMMARVNYSYKDRYLLTATGRRDGASVFSQNHKFGFFPSMGLGWILSEESFLHQVPFVNFLKVRFSWGANGNQAINRYQSLSTIEPKDNYDYLFDGNTAYGIAATAMGNPDLKWESTYATNYGVDFELFHSRVSGSINYYNSNTRNLLVQRNIPNLNGFSSVVSNLGAVNNRGLEIELTTINVDNGSIKWQTGVNFARNKNKIVHLYGVRDANGKEEDDISNQWFIGKSLGAYYNYKPTGIWQKGDEIPTGFRAGDVKLKDVNGDGAITADQDREILGYNKPDFTFGFNTTVQYKGFSLYAQVTGSVGGVRNNNDLLDPPVNFTYRMRAIYENWWTPDNPSRTLPSLDYQDAYHIYFLQSTTWVRIQDISLSYTFPKAVIDRLKMQRFQLYLSAKNPFLFTRWGGWDPETTGSGRSQYPTMRSLILGVNLSL